MNTPGSGSIGHSAEVHMELRLGGRILTIAQLGPDFPILADPIDHPPADAEISMSIDDHETRWPVRLPDGISRAQRRTPLCPPPTATGSAAG